MKRSHRGGGQHHLGAIAIRGHIELVTPWQVTEAEGPNSAEVSFGEIPHSHIWRVVVTVVADFACQGAEVISSRHINSVDPIQVCHDLYLLLRIIQQVKIPCRILPHL